MISSVPILDLFVADNKTPMSYANEYACDMKDIRKIAADATEALIGPDRRFRSARELAQRAHTLGIVENADSFARNVSRVIEGEQDPRVGTLDAIARAAGMRLSDFIGGKAPPKENVKSVNNGVDEPQSVESINARRVKLISELLLSASSQLLEVVEHLIEIEGRGGKTRSLVMQDIEATLQLFPKLSTEIDKKEAGS